MDRTDECRLTLCCSSCPVEEGARIGLILAEDLRTFWSKQIKKIRRQQLVGFHFLSMRRSKGRLTLIQNKGHVALSHLVALLCQQQVLDQRSVRFALPEAAVRRHETLRPSATFTHVFEKLKRAQTLDDNADDECDQKIAKKPHLHGCMAGTHHTRTGGMHLGQVVEGQDVARLGGQVEEFKSLFVISLHTDAI